MITLTRREYITPTVYIDEPETGLHPKRNEELISKLHDTYISFKKSKPDREIGKYKTPYPKIIFSTHSPNILKYVIKLFRNDQQILHFSKDKNSATRVSKMNSQYKDERFLNIFSDNEARLFFSNFILFVEGETELELFGNLKLLSKFPKLKKVDVYKNNNVTLKYTNPSYSNVSIPYLVLYDADKLIRFDITTNLFTFKKDSINLNKLFDRVKKSYFGSKHYNQKQMIKEVLKVESQKQIINTDPLNIKYSDGSIHSFVAFINSTILNKNHFMIAATTIEGSLINSDSLPIFRKWLIYEVISNLHSKNKNVSKTMLAYNSMHGRGHNNSYIFSSLFGIQGKESHLTIPEQAFVKKVKYDYLKDIRKKLRNFHDQDEELIMFRLIFGGKTDTLVSCENNSYNLLDQNFRNIVKDIKENDLSALSYLFGKTNGWVTSFLDYSIEHISLKYGNSSFEKKFKHFFPEIYDIIERASSSID